VALILDRSRGPVGGWAVSRPRRSQEPHYLRVALDFTHTTHTRDGNENAEHVTDGY